MQRSLMKQAIACSRVAGPVSMAAAPSLTLTRHSSTLAACTVRPVPLSSLLHSHSTNIQPRIALNGRQFVRHHAASPTPLHGTTILAVRRGSDVVVIGDGQVSMGGTVFKPNARKVRVIGGGKVITGFAGSTADCFALLDALEKKLDEYPGQLLRACVELAKMWRTDKYLRHLDAMLIAVDKDMSVTLGGNGDVISEPMDGVIGIGSGGLFALSAARALVDIPSLNAREIALRSMRIAADICVYTNKNFTVEAFENGELITGEKRAQREAEDRAYAEQADIEMREKIERNTLSSLTPTPPTPTTPSTDKK